jgi:hypothetical protein
LRCLEILTFYNLLKQPKIYKTKTEWRTVLRVLVYGSGQGFNSVPNVFVANLFGDDLVTLHTGSLHRLAKIPAAAHVRLCMSLEFTVTFLNM